MFTTSPSWDEGDFEREAELGGKVNTEQLTIGLFLFLLRRLQSFAEFLLLRIEHFGTIVCLCLLRAGALIRVKEVVVKARMSEVVELAPGREKTFLASILSVEGGIDLSNTGLEL